MYNIRLISKSSELELLYQELQKTIGTGFPTSQLLRELEMPDHIIVGLFKGKQLVGFINGYGLDNHIYYFCNMYVKQQYRFKVRDMLEEAEKAILKLKYTGWLTHSKFKSGINMLLKFGAEKIK